MQMLALTLDSDGEIENCLFVLKSNPRNLFFTGWGRGGE